MTIEPAGGAHDLGRPELEGMFETKLAEAFASLGCFNLAVFGKTGAGKSIVVGAISLVLGGQALALSFTTVVIDAGHGGKDGGAVWNEIGRAHV